MVMLVKSGKPSVRKTRHRTCDRTNISNNSQINAVPTSTSPTHTDAGSDSGIGSMASNNPFPFVSGSTDTVVFGDTEDAAV